MRSRRNGDGNRVEKSSLPAVAGGTLYWYGLNSAPLEETNLTGGMLRDYIFFGGERISVYTPTSAILAFFDDHLGSTSKFESVSSAGAVTLEFDADYAPFGRVREFGSDLYDPAFKFMGKEYDGETALDNFGARYNDPTIGRFISAAKRAPRSPVRGAWEIDRAPRSPVRGAWEITHAVPAPVPYANLTNPQTLNLYALVRDNPETFADLDGHASGNMGQCDQLVDVCATLEGQALEGDGPPAQPNTGDKQPLSDSQQAADANPNVQSDEQNSSQKKTNDQEDKDKPKPDDPTPGTQPSKAGGGTGSGQGKGERRFTGKPEYKPGKGRKLPKGWRLLPDGRYEYDDPHTGKPVIKPKDWFKSHRTVIEGAAGTGLAVGAGYIIYRVVRFVPSLAPPLWWTIPFNLATP